MTEKCMFIYTIDIYDDIGEEVITESGLIYAEDIVDTTNQICQIYSKDNIEKLQIDCYVEAPLIFNSTDEKAIIEKLVNKY